MSATAVAAIEVRDLRFRWPGAQTDCLDIAEFVVAPGEAVFLHGPSGSGKSTLLNLLGGVVLPQAGMVRLLGRDLTGLAGAARDRLRADHLGFIFQQFNLVPYLPVLDNVLLATRFSARRRDAATAAHGSPAAAARALLDGLEVGGALAGQRADTLSVGQQQRVAAARALIGAPDVVIADEPTSALDEDLRQAFLTLLTARCRAHGTALVFVSHDRRMAAAFDRTVALADINRQPRGAGA
ncbi:MAG: ATP-binding cassette domain-containing protein [Burkholderiales bacterium]